jgi:YesN/AraC family two-component response regulator
MHKKTVLVIAEKHASDFYSSLVLDEEKVENVPLRKSLDFIRNNGADIVLLDCGRNAAKGIDLLGEIKRFAHDIPVIFLTDVGSDGIAVRAYKTGVRDYYRKPVNVLELRNTIVNLLQIKRNSTERREPLPFINNSKTFDMTGGITSDIPANIIRAVFYIEENLSGVNSLDDIAKQANLSKYHFSRVFKKLTGLSPMEFVKLLKINKAKELLRKKDLPVLSVAVEVGYFDLRTFERMFKKYTGVTPTAYRRSLHKR